MTCECGDDVPVVRYARVVGVEFDCVVVGGGGEELCWVLG